jgi:hypothetical protein
VIIEGLLYRQVCTNSLTVFSVLCFIKYKPGGGLTHVGTGKMVSNWYWKDANILMKSEMI